MKYYLSLVIIILFQELVSAQTIFQGIVKDSITYEPLINATILQKNSSNGIVTDINGHFNFPYKKSEQDTLIIQYIGYNTKLIVIENLQTDSISEILLSSSSEELEEIIVSSIRTNSRIDDIPTRVEVLGLEDMIDENGIKPGNIMSILGDMAGVQMQQVSANSGNTYARIQGLNGRYTQLLKDGIPLYGGLSGSFGILQIPPLDLKQIEIIRGSCATLYGGDAIGGIINLVSKDPSNKQDFGFTINQTSLSETNVNVYAAKKYKQIGYTFFAGQTLQQAIDVDKDGLSNVPFVNSTVIHPKLIFYINPALTLTLNYSATIDNRKGGDMNYLSKNLSDSLFHINNLMKRHSADIKLLNEFSKNSNLSVKLSSSYLNQDMQTKYYAFKATQLIYFSEISYFLQQKKMNWVIGVNLNGDKFDNNSLFINPIYNYTNQTIGGFIQNTYNPFKKLTIESGFRLDYHSTYHFFPLPRLSFLYKINKTFTARINGGMGYKAPTFISYINPETQLNLISSSNTLKPEYSQGLNADINFQRLIFNKLFITVNQTFFITNISSPIYDSSSIVSTINLINASNPLQTKGFQTYSRLSYNKWELYISYVFTDVTKKYDIKYPTPLVTPKNNFSSVITYKISKRWNAGIESSYIATQLNQYYKPAKNYFIFAAMVQFNYKKFYFVLNGENLLDIRQNKYERIFDGTISNPIFHELWAPIDGRIINFSINWKL